jgi:hypothetical protein
VTRVSFDVRRAPPFRDAAGKIQAPAGVLSATFRDSGHPDRKDDMSDQDRSKHVKATDEHLEDDVEAHKHGHREADAGSEDSSDDVIAHKHGGKDS